MGVRSGATYRPIDRLADEPSGQPKAAGWGALPSLAGSLTSFEQLAQHNTATRNHGSKFEFMVVPKELRRPGNTHARAWKATRQALLIETSGLPCTTT